MSRFFGNFDPTTTASTVTGETTDTRSHSHVWNYSDVYDGNFADTWPSNDSLTPLVTSTGATAVEPGNGFRYFIFTTSGSLTIPAAAAGISVEYLIVAGGGSGAGNRGGGGGAGGLRTNVSGNPLAGSSMTLPATTYPVTVGGGGASTTGGFPFSGSPTAGTASSFNSIVSAGGGIESGDGGSGGGGHTYPGDFSAGDGNTPPVTPPQGNAGGVGGQYNTSRAGAGGGAGGAGNHGVHPGGPAAGGNGHPIPAFASPLISPGVPAAAATAIGPTGLFAGGGGGGGSSNGITTGGAGGPGGGGAGGNSDVNPGTTNPTSGADGPGGGPGVDNTGGGGGGGGNYAGSNPKMRPAGAGGKGIVILRFEL